MIKARALSSVLVLGLIASVLALVPAHAADNNDSVGLADRTTGIWYLRSPGGQTTSFFFGNPGDYPIMGDWDCDGVDTPGLYRQSDGYVYLRNSNTQGPADIRFFFGDPGDIPLAGDFNGDGCDTVSIYRPAEARVFVINELGSNDGGLGAADFAFYFGDVGDKPFTADFDDDGIDEVGLHRESTGFVYYRNTLTTGVADNQFFYGDPGDQIISGRWVQNLNPGPDTVGIFRPSQGQFYLRFSNNQGNADAQFPYGNSNMAAIAGRFGNLPGGGTPPPGTEPSTDPWNPSPSFYQMDTLGVDHIEAWVCHVDESTAGITPSDLVAMLEGRTRDWFEHYSGGRLSIEATIGGTISGRDLDDCESQVKVATSGNAEVAVVVSAVTGGISGFAYYRDRPGDFPENGRLAFLDALVVKDDWAKVAIHELLHTMQWPHIVGRGWGIMSQGSFLILQAPSAIFRYRSGWMDPANVIVFKGGTEEYTLKANLESGSQMLVIQSDAQYRFITVAPRVHDATWDDLIPPGRLGPREGVEVIVSDYECDYVTYRCNPHTDFGSVKNDVIYPSNQGIVGVGETIDFADLSNYHLDLYNDPAFYGVPVTLEVLSKDGNTVRVRVSGDVPDVRYGLPDALPVPDRGMFVDDEVNPRSEAIRSPRWSVL